MKNRFFMGMVLMILGVVSHAQQPKKLSWNDQFILDKSNRTFPVPERFVTLTGKAYDFSTAKRPAFVYISSESCLPCKFELPLYINACKQYPGFDFVYFTTDPDTLAVKKKFGEETGLANLYIIMKSYDYFYDHQLMLGFPTKYYINSKQKVQTVQLGGYMVTEKVLAEWEPVLTHLQ